ncbi:MAG: hypothetical protein WBV82_17180 [Myxococcaceae bacterium]
MLRTSLIAAGILFVGCGSSRPDVPEAGQRDAGAVDAGACSVAPLSNAPLCQEGCGYLCGDQCPHICSAGGCWTCLSGEWQFTWVDCATDCP